MTLVLMLWKLQVPKNIEKSTNKKVEGKQILRDIVSIPSAILMFGVSITGLTVNLLGTYLYLYLQRDLGASSELIAYTANITFGSQALFLIISDKVVEFVGYANSICVNIFLEVIQLLVYAYVKQTPPYYALGLHALNFSLWGYAYVAMLKNAYLITPPYLTGTMTSIIIVTITVTSKSCFSF